MVNILSEKARRELLTLYYVRLTGTFFFLVALFLLVGAGLLAPSYLLARDEAVAAKRYLDALEQTLSLNGGKDAGVILSATKERVSLLKSYDTEAVMAGSVAALAGAVPTGVRVTVMRVALLSDGTSGTVTLSGIAESRADLVAFVSALQGHTSFRGVSLPVSNLASDMDITFSLSFDLNIEES